MLLKGTVMVPLRWTMKNLPGSTDLQINEYVDTTSMDMRACLPIRGEILTKHCKYLWVFLNAKIGSMAYKHSKNK